MPEALSKEDLALIEDEVSRYEKTYDRIRSETIDKTRDLHDNQKLAREITSQIVSSQRDEEKQALQNEESVAHGLAKLRLEQSNALGDLLEQPYFARVIYNENNRDIEFKLGLASFPEERIIDWRKAPISKLYYDYEEGEEYDDEIAGKERHGTIKLKRAYRGQERNLGAIELKECAFVKTRGSWQKTEKNRKQTYSIKDKDKIQELLKQKNYQELERLSRSEGYLHNVLSLLTPEQFGLITLSEDQPIIIQGSAGTGKTTVALHRLAWLMFKGNSTAKAENTLVIMFNSSLAAYVKHVLPELGIHNVKITTFFDWANDILETDTGKQWSFLEKDIHYTVAKFKSHHKTHDFFAQYLENNPINQPIENVLKNFFNDPQTKTRINALPKASSIKPYIEKQINEGWFDIYDIAFLLQAIYKKNNCFRAKKHPTFVDYLVLDEAQDFTIGELRCVLNSLEDKTHLTLAGDLGQKILENRDFGDWNELLVELGLTGVDVINLNVAYRSTYQIYELAENIRNPAVQNEDLHLTPKFGPEPTLTICHNFSDTVIEAKNWIDRVRQDDRNAIGCVICKTRSEARQVYDSLIKTGTHGIRYGDSHHFEFTPGITITDVKQVKGLEFTNVLVFQASENSYKRREIHDRNSLYVAVTRAEYKLDFLCYGPPSALIPSFVEQIDLTARHENLEDKPLFSDVDQDTSRFDADDDEFEDEIIIAPDLDEE